MSDVPSYEYIAYIDEAGDPGVRRVAPIDPKGATEWFTLSCVLVSATKEDEPIEFVRRARARIKSIQRPDIHYKNLKPWQRLAVCSELAAESIRIFCVASNKQSMHGYRNRKAEAVSLHPNNYFYNYCIRILLERVTLWVEQRSLADFGEPRKMKIIFSERGGHSYRHVETYTELLELQTKNDRLFQNIRAPKFSVMDRSLMEVIQHTQNAGLQMADIVASAFYQAANASDNKNWDVAPAEALQPRVSRMGGIWANHGLTLLPWMSWHPKLTDDQKKIFRLYGYRI